MSPLALTMGEPAGIGGEIAQGAWQALRATGPAFLLIDDADRLTGVPVRRIAAPEAAAGVFAAALPVLHRPLPHPAVPGRIDPANAPAVIAAIDEAVALAKAGRVSAVVTNPINKDALYRAGFRHPISDLKELAEVFHLLACCRCRPEPHQHAPETHAH